MALHLIRHPIRTRTHLAPALAPLRTLHASPVRHADQSTPSPDPQPATATATDDKGKLSASKLVQSVLYGSPTAKQEGDLAVQQHSRLVGRGKYVHEIQKHKVQPGKVEEYKQKIGDYYTKLAQSPEFECRLTGSWEVVVGELDTFVHIWEYEGFSGFDSTKFKILKSEPHYNTFDTSIRPLLQSRTSQLGQEFAFWASSPPKTLGGIYEMRSYQLKPGTLLEWESEWRRGLEARRRYVEPIGAWFSQVGLLHQVHHMWQYESLQSRHETRAKAWEVENWSKTVSKTVKLCYEMEANILSPLPWSPLK